MLVADVNQTVSDIVEIKSKIQTTSDLKSESSGSHEILLRYSFKMRPAAKLPTHYRNIRYN